MTETLPRMITGLAEIAADYDAAICDVWGVIHDGRRVHGPAVEALARFRRERGPVVLLSNAPRLPDDVFAQFARLGVPSGAYDALVTSGGAARDELMRRTAAGGLAMLHLGPERDRSVFAGLDVQPAGPDQAEIVLCTGLRDDDREGPDDYRDLFARLKARGLAMLCANPDIVVQRGDRLVYCAGALARAYEEMGGRVLYFGKPHRPVYDAALAALRRHGAAGQPLAIGDGLETDIRGANAAGIDALFIADGVHGEAVGSNPDAESLNRLFSENGVRARAAMRALQW